MTTAKPNRPRDVWHEKEAPSSLPVLSSCVEMWQEQDQLPLLVSNPNIPVPQGLACLGPFLSNAEERTRIQHEVLSSHSCSSEGFSPRRRVWRFKLSLRNNKDNDINRDHNAAPKCLLGLARRFQEETNLEADHISIEEYPVARWVPSGEYASHQTVTKFESLSVANKDMDKADSFFMAQIPLNKTAIQHLNQPAKKRMVHSWSLLSPDHQTDVRMEPGMLFLKTGDCLWDWRYSLRASDNEQNGDNDTAYDSNKEPVLVLKLYALPPPISGTDHAHKDDDTFGYIPSSEEDSVMQQRRKGDVKMPLLRELLTIIITTSPIRSNPSTELIEKSMETFVRAGEEFAFQCRKVIVCDGYRLADNGDNQNGMNNNNSHNNNTVENKVTRRHGNVKQAMRNGIVTDNQAEQYQQFKDALRQKCQRAVHDPSSLFYNTVVEELEERQGYGFALRHALQHCVSTPFVCVIQHDRTFMRPTPMQQILECMWKRPNVKYVGLSMRSNLMYRDMFDSKYGSTTSGSDVGSSDNVDDDEFGSLIQRPPELQVDAQDYGSMDSQSAQAIQDSCTEKVWKSIQLMSKAYQTSHQNLGHLQWLQQPQNAETVPLGKAQMSLTPTLFWFDNIHVTDTAHYRDFIFDPSYKMVARGGFVEDKLSPVLVRMVERMGLREGHSRFGCFLLDDHSGVFFTGHLDGGSFETDQQRKARFPPASARSPAKGERPD